MSIAKHHLLLLETDLPHRALRFVNELVDFAPLLVLHKNAADRRDPFLKSLIIKLQRFVV